MVVCLQVTMSDRSAAERACKDANPIIDGRKTNVNLAYLGAKPRILPGRALPGIGEQRTKTYFISHNAAYNRNIYTVQAHKGRYGYRLYRKTRLEAHALDS